MRSTSFFTVREDATAVGAAVNSGRLSLSGRSRWGADNQGSSRTSQVLRLGFGLDLSLLFLLNWGDRSLEAKLELGLGSTDESLVDLGVVGVEGDVAAG